MKRKNAPTSPLERVRFWMERALPFCFDAFSIREPVSTSLENTLETLDPRGKHDRLRVQRSDVLVHAEEVCWVVLGFQGDEAVVVVAIGGLKFAVVSIVHHEIHIAAVSRVRMHGRAVLHLAVLSSSGPDQQSRRNAWSHPSPPVHEGGFFLPVNSRAASQNGGAPKTGPQRRRRSARW